MVRFGAHVLGIFGLLSATAAFALAPDKAFHQYVRDTWSIEEGLPQITVAALVQGPDGYIWAGTQAGVARFDGVRFSVYEPGNSPAMPAMFIQALFVDSRERVWAGTYRGAAVFRDGQFHGVADRDGRELDVFEFAETGDGQLLMATDHGLMRLVDDAFEHCPGDPDEALRSVFRHDERLFAGGYGAVYVHDADGWRRMPLDGELSSTWINEFAAYDGRIWAASTSGLLYLEDGQWRRFASPGALGDEVIETLHADRDGNLWLGAANSLLRMHRDELVETVPDDAPYAHSSVLAMTEDHEGNLWLGSRWEGLARLWNGWVFRYDRPEGLHNSLVWTVARDDAGDVWTGTMDGLSVLRDGRFEQVVPGADQPHPHAYTVLPESDRVWVGTRTGLYWWDREAGRVQKPEAFGVLDNAQINGVVPVDGQYWVATTEGVWRWDGEAMRRLVARSEPGGRDIRLIHETSSSERLVGTRRGLLRWRVDDERFERVEGIPAGRDVTAIGELSSGRLVVGTLDEKLYVTVGERWHEFDADDGLPVNSPFALGEADGRLWVAGIRGIYELPLAAIDQYLAGEIDALPGRMVLNERGDVPGAQKGWCCNGAGNAKGFMHDGEFWLPTRGGIVHLVPGRIRRNAAPPRVHIDRVRDGQGWRALAGEDSLELPADQRDVAFGFAVLSYQDPSSVQLEYRLEGFRSEWQRLDEPMQRQAIYTNLPSGDFTLQLRAGNNAGVWVDEPATLSLRVRPRVWETVWFQIGALVVALMLIWLGFNYRLRHVQRQKQMLEHTVADRTEELRVANENLRDYSARLETASMTDPLTGLWNRRYLASQLPADLSHLHRELSRPQLAGQSLVFAVLDIDHFKSINDRYGHGAGDDILGQFARLLENLVRRGDYVVRWGGEEFLIVLRPMPHAEIDGVAERLVDGVRRHAFELQGGETVHLTCSLGLTVYPAFRDLPGALDWEQAVSLADKALFHVKQTRRDGWCRVCPTPRVEPATLAGHLGDSLEALVEAHYVRIDAEG